LREIGAFEAKNKLGQLLDQVEHGEEIIITRHGRPAAKLVPAGHGFDRDKARRAAEDQGPGQRRPPVTFVVDSSVSLAWCFEDEQTAAVMELLDRVAETGAIVPQLWPLEALNGLLMAERRGRLDAARRRRLGGLLQSLPIVLDAETAGQAWSAVARLAEEFRLTTYDAAYLELAQRRTLPLATLDLPLRTAGKALGLTLLGIEP
jgi:prevent-host-death family protein